MTSTSIHERLRAVFTRVLEEHRLEDQANQVARLSVEVESLERAKVSQRRHQPVRERWRLLGANHHTRRANRLQAELNQARAALENQQATLAQTLDRLAEHYPPFGLARSVGDVLDAVHELTTWDRRLIKRHSPHARLNDTIGALITSLETLYLDGTTTLELIHVLDEDTSPTSRPPSLEVHPTRGFKALSATQILAFAHKQEDSTRDQRDQLLDELAGLNAQLSARGSTFAGRLSRWTPWNDHTLGELRKNRDTTYANWASLKTQHLLAALDALATFPPMAMLWAAFQMQGVARLLGSAHDDTVVEDGTVRRQPCVNRRALLLLSSARLRASFERALPGVPIPAMLISTARARLQPPHIGPRSPWFETEHMVLAALERANIDHHARTCLEHVQIAGLLAASRRHVLERVPVRERMAFWRATPDETTAQSLKTRLQWHDDQLTQHWSELTERTRAIGSRWAALHQRDTAVALHHALRHVSVITHGQAQRTMSVKIKGLDKVTPHLDALQENLAETFALRGDRLTLLTDVARKLHNTAHNTWASKAKQLALPTSYNDAVNRMAFELRNTPFAEAFTRVCREMTRHNPTSRAQHELRVFWDDLRLLNVYEDTTLRQTLHDQLESLRTPTLEFLLRLDRHTQRALNSYPPAALYFEVGALRRAIARIQAVPQAHSVTIGNGNARRVETRVRGALVGHREALQVLQLWSAHMVNVFGTVPGYHALPERWAQAVSSSTHER